MAARGSQVEAVLRRLMLDDHGRLLSVLIGQLRDFQLAEDCLQDALSSALVHWRRGGPPASPAAWILQVARRKAIDRLRRHSVAERYGVEIEYLMRLDQHSVEDAQDIPDDRLRLIFACCHPALEFKSQVALTLRAIGGLSTEQIARAFLDKTPAMAQRLSRAKTKIAKAGIPFAIPQAEDLPARVQGVAHVIYLIFNEGYAATEGPRQIRDELCEEALYLARLMRKLCPEDAEIEGLLALILLTHARRKARDSAAYVPLSAQNRRLWDAGLIEEGAALVEQALLRGRAGPFQLQAAIAALHCQAESHAATDWSQIAALYRLLARMDDSPVVRLNAAVARAYAGQAEQALDDLAKLHDALSGYQPYHAARAELLAMNGQSDLAATAYEDALALTRIDSERAFLADRRNGL